jgi:hypothetical protein
MRFAYPGYGPASHRPGLGPPSAGCGIPARSPDKAAGRIRGIGSHRRQGGTCMGPRMRFASPGYGPASHRPGLGPPSAGRGMPARSPDKAAGRIRGIGCASSAGRHVHGAPDALRLSGLRSCTLERLIADVPERESPRPNGRRAGASPGRGRGPHPGPDSTVGAATRALRPGCASLIRATCGRGPDPCAQSQAAPSHPHTLTPSHPHTLAPARWGAPGGSAAGRRLRRRLAAPGRRWQVHRVGEVELHLE